MPINFKNWRKTILLFGTALIALTLGAVAYHYHLKSAVDRYRAELKAKGALVELPQFRPPPVPPDRDGTFLFLRAVSRITNTAALSENPPPAMRLVAPGKAMIGAAQDQIDYGQATNSWADVQALIDPNKESLALLTRMIERPHLELHTTNENGFVELGLFSKTHFSDIRHSARLLANSAMFDLHQGNAGAAVRKTRAALCIVGAMESQRLVISELARISAAVIAQGTTWEILQLEISSEEELAALQKDWQQLDFLRGYRQALALDCASACYPLREVRNANTDIHDYFATEGDETRDRRRTWSKRLRSLGQQFLWRYWWSYSDELRALKGYEAMRGTALYAETNGAYSPALKQQDADLEVLGIAALTNESDQYHSIFAQSVKALDGCLKTVMVAEAAKRMTVTAIALKRYELAHGKYPETLSELAPQFVESIPLDPVDGKPLRYNLNPDGTFLLYSIGENGTDDGGDSQVPKTRSTFSWQRGRDWVWPQPASQEEVLAWQNKQGKKK